MKQRHWVTYSTVVAAVVKLVAVAFVPIPALVSAQDWPHWQTGVVFGGHLRLGEAPTYGDFFRDIYGWKACGSQ
jgi:hypothetical protein